MSMKRRQRRLINNQQSNDTAEVPEGGISPTGLRNNNPFNIEFRTSIQWRGQVGTDGRFVIFDSPLNGLRAGMINIHTQITANGFNTIRKLIQRLSPSIENPTENFITFVSEQTGIAAEQPIQYDRDILPLSKAIVTFENGENPFSDSLYEQALAETGRV